MIRVALADDHPLILRILLQELRCELDFRILWHTSDPTELLTLTRKETPDVIVLDLAFTGHPFEPVSMVREFRVQHPQMAILILTAYDDPIWVEELIQAGAQGYVVKSDDFSLRLADGIRTVAQQRTFLSPTAIKALTSSQKKYTLTERERTILRLATEGKSNVQLAETLGVAHGTIRNHWSNIYAKLDVTTHEAAIRAAQDLRELPRAGVNRRHEIHTPLYTLMGIARVLMGRLERNGQLSADDSDLLQQIILEAERLDSLLGEYP